MNTLDCITINSRRINIHERVTLTVCELIQLVRIVSLVGVHQHVPSGGVEAPLLGRVFSPPCRGAFSGMTALFWDGAKFSHRRDVGAAGSSVTA